MKKVVLVLSIIFALSMMACNNSSSVVNNDNIASNNKLIQKSDQNYKSFVLPNDTADAGSKDTNPKSIGRTYTVNYTEEEAKEILRQQVTVNDQLLAGFLYDAEKLGQIITIENYYDREIAIIMAKSLLTR